MLDNDTKRRIDEARDILVGKVPTPQSQVEQITIALIYKFMDDMDKESVSLGGNAVFFSGEYEKYSWTKIFDPRLGGFDIINLYSEAIEKLNHNPNIPQLFRDIFKNAYLPYRDPETLKLFLKTINEFHYDHSERLGDAFEYLLSVLGSQGDAGQFRTPRHIIDFIVSVVEPKKSDSILDPSCGTAGFLISSYKFILEQNTNKSKGDLLTPIERKRLMTNFYGYDISPDMVRLSLVNMYLHGFTTPLIFEYDTLTSEDRWGDTFDVILANPPFMTPKGGIKPHKKFTLQVNRSEVLFVDYIAEHINPVSGRAGIIVPEGIIFQSSNAYKQLRKMLVDSSLLYAVVSLPAGVFNPYAGVKTSILLLDKSLAKKTDKILFVKIENDGFDLGAQRREVEGSNLPNATDLIIQFKESLLTKSEFISDNKNVFLIEKSKIASKEDYNLSIDRYRIDENVKQSNFETVRLGDICDTFRGITFSKKDQLDYEDENTLRVATTKASQSWGIDESSLYYIPKRLLKNKSLLLKENDILISIANSLDLVGRVSLVPKVNYEFTFGAFMGLIRAKEEQIHPIFLYHLLKSKSAKNYYLANARTTTNISNLNFTILNEFEIPLPPLSVQKEIVAKIENYQAIINGAKQVVENYKPQIDINPDWKMIELGDVMDKINDSINPQDYNEKVKYIGLENIESNTGCIVGNIETECSTIKSTKSNFIIGDILYGKLRPNLNKVWLANIDGICSTDILVLRVKNDIAINKFYSTYLRSEIFNNEVLKGIKGAQLPRVGFDYFSTIQIPLPSLEEQQEIVSRIEKEQSIINSNKELIKIYEQKIKDEINKLWKK